MTENTSNTREEVEKTFAKSLVIGICSTKGSFKQNVIAAIKDRLSEYDYDCQVIRISDCIGEYTILPKENIPGETQIYTNTMRAINGGNELRKRFSKSFLAEWSIKQIYKDRLDISGDIPEIINTEQIEENGNRSKRKCYIVDSIKNREELRLLRTVYRGLFYFISIFSPERERREVLRNRGLSDPEIGKLISVDEYQNDEYGQDVRNTFIEADFFIRVSKENRNDIPNKIERYLHLVFDSNVITPLKHEVAMYEAKSAASNSACLSRQVGAAITDENGVLLAKGWNDVPKYGGNLYQDDDYERDHRCKVLGYCSNDKTKDRITEEIVNEIINNEALKKELLHGRSDITEESIKSVIKNLKQIIRTSAIKDLIEYSRAVHAEMHALIVGSQLNGSRMVGGKLFCTTYPCHNCARHIILSGIKEIYYIEPYVRSLGIKLHSDALTEDETKEEKVKLLVYDGVAPRRYLKFFSSEEKRKNKDGSIKKKDLASLTPRSRLSLQALPTIERGAIRLLIKSGFTKAISNKEEDSF